MYRNLQILNNKYLSYSFISYWSCVKPAQMQVTLWVINAAHWALMDLNKTDQEKGQ